jgi:hypothetical protein
MGQLRIPKGAEGAFRIMATDAFGGRFAINLYGAGRHGWFAATRRQTGSDRDSGLQPLEEGDWPRLLERLDECGFWALPEDGSHLVDPTVVVSDGEWLTIAGRRADRSHRIERFVWREPGLDALLSFGRRISGFDVPRQSAKGDP